MKQLMMILLLVATLCNVHGQQPATSLNGNWKLVASSGSLVQQLQQTQVPELRFDTSDKTISGFAGCNQLSGQFTIEKDQLTIGPLILTKKACEHMELEFIIERFLTNVGSYKLERDSLYLYNKSDRNIYLLFNRKAGSI